MERVRVEVRIGSQDYVPLIDGPIVAQRFELSASPGESTMTLVAHDDSVLLNQDEDVELFEDQTPDQIASTLIEEAGLAAETDSTPDAGSNLPRYTVRRGSAMQLLRELARRHGMFAYVRPGSEPGQSVGVFVRPNLTAGDLPELLLMGAERNVNRFSAEFDALRPATARADSVRISDKTLLTSETEVSGQDPLGERPTHDLVSAGQLLLARTREEEADLDAATQAVADLSSWAFSASGEVTGDVYTGVLTPYEVIRVAGVGGYLAGDYLISGVTHTLDFDSYRQEFKLRRNARLNGSNGASSIAGVF
jgi:phage protein D